MFWKLIDRGVQLTFLLLAVVLITTLLKNDKYNEDLTLYTSRLDVAIKELKRVQEQNVMYLEEKTNRVQVRSDSYQTTMSNTVSVLEQRVQRLEKDNKEKTNNVNINSNYNSNVNK